jgi:two-component system, cell cycle response regulator
MSGTYMGNSQHLAPGAVGGTGSAPTALQDSRPLFRVAIFGLNYKFQRLLEIVVRHARHNQYRFVLAGSRGPGDYDIALVDMTTKGGPEVAATLNRLIGGQAIVRVGRRADPTRPIDDLVYQNFTMNLLVALNRVAESGIRRAVSGVGQVAQVVRREIARAGDNLLSPLSGTPVRLAPLPVQRATNLRALIVDDSATVRRQMCLALQQMGMDADAVGLAQEALDQLSVRSYDIIFADVMMPGMDGYKLTKLIKKDRNLRAIPVVILTSRSSPFDLARGAFAGCNSYLVKPVSLKSLKRTILKNLSRTLPMDSPLPAGLRPA